MSDDLPPRMRAAMRDLERVLDGRGPQRARQQRLDRRGDRSGGMVIDPNGPGQDVVVSSEESRGGGEPTGFRR